MSSEDFEIEILDSAEEEQLPIQLPLNFLTQGDVSREDVSVYIRQDVFDALESLAASDTSRELGSILLGEYLIDQGKVHVVISGFIEAKYTDASAATLTFTHQTWDYVHQEQARLYPEKKIVGWQHTHPSFGVFLSGYDLFIQEYFFNLPFQIAYVIDPVKHTRGFFQWKQGMIQPLMGFHIYEEPGKAIRSPAAVEKQKMRLSQWITIFLILGAILVIGAVLFGSKKDSQTLPPAQHDYQTIEIASRHTSRYA